MAAQGPAARRRARRPGAGAVADRPQAEHRGHRAGHRHRGGGAAAADEDTAREAADDTAADDAAAAQEETDAQLAALDEALGKPLKKSPAPTRSVCR